MPTDPTEAEIEAALDAYGPRTNWRALSEPAPSYMRDSMRDAILAVDKVREARAPSPSADPAMAPILAAIREAMAQPPLYRGFQAYTEREDARVSGADALRAEVARLLAILRDARPFCLGLGEGFAEGCAVADRIDAALASAPAAVEPPADPYLEKVRQMGVENDRLIAEMADEFAKSVKDAATEPSAKKCSCQDEHRRGYCREPTCPYFLGETQP